MNLQELQQLIKSPQFSTLAHNLRSSGKHADEERERVNAYSVPLLISYNFRSIDDGSRIEDTDQLYLAPDGPKIEQFYEALDKAHAEHGAEGLEKGHCPALIARNAHLRAKAKLLQRICLELEMPESLRLDHQDQVIEKALEAYDLAQAEAA